ncbi:helix-turn-helix domain-containing protein [Paenibacillus marinisediminis]
MFPVSSTPSFRAAFFWRHFINYFMLIFIPVIVASILVHLLVVSLIEEDAKKLNNMMISKFTEQADTEFNRLKTNMINMLSNSNIRSLLSAVEDKNQDPFQRAELIQTLREQLNKLQSEALVSKAYLYFVHHDLVIDAEIYTDKSYYFNHSYPLTEQQQTSLQTNFMGKKMMSFLEQQGTIIPAVTSYPFNTNSPDVYLVVNVQHDKLQELIRIQQEWVMGTAIVGTQGQVLSRAGLDPQEINMLNMIPSQDFNDSKETKYMINGDNALLVVPSGFDDAWHYLSIIDQQLLMKPADMTRMIIWLFLAFFLMVGSIVSYMLSRLIYRPIMEIQENLKSHRPAASQMSARENEFDVINRFSRLLVIENKQLSQLINGMLPIVQEHFIAKMLQGQYRDELSIETYAKEIGFTYSKKAMRTVLCIAFHYSAEYEALSESSRSFLMAELKERIHQLFPATIWFCQTKPDTLACVVHQDPILHLTSMEDANLLKMALQLYSTYFKASIGIGRNVHTIEDLHQSYETAMSALQLRRLHSDIEICTASTEVDSVPCDTFLSVQEVTHMLNQYKTREYNKLLQHVYDVIDEGVHMNATVIQMKQLCTDILNTWIRAVEVDRKDFNVSFYADMYQKLNRSITGDELKACFADIHKHLFPTAEFGDKAKKFNDILTYIHEHYDEELSIDYFAETLNMSVGHFSRTFKEEVGEKYVDYIAKYRLMRAKEMLLTTDWKIDDIAEKVGYWGRNSFIRMFRRYEGITPAQYRGIHQ